ncbi:MAG: hypothetical protein SGILL_001192 [Bacillariaceae sp.]
MAQFSNMNNILTGISRRSKDCQEALDSQISSSMALAERLKAGGQLEDLLDKETMAEYRESLKEIALDNVEKERQLKAYKSAVVSLGNGPNASVADDFQGKLEVAVKEQRGIIEQQHMDPKEEPTYLQLCQQLGETPGNEDDDIAVIPVQDTQSLKCPITRHFLEDPVKNTVCGHKYSRAAILQQLRTYKKCPVAGCTNTNVTVSQLETDELTATFVRRAMKRQKMEEQKLSQNAVDLEDDDDDDA